MPEGERHLIGKAHTLSRSRFDLFRSTQPNVCDRNPVTQCEAGRVGVFDLPSPTQILLAHPGSLIGKAQMPKTPCLVVRGSNARIVAEAMGEIAMRDRIVVVDRFLQECERLLEVIPRGSAPARAFGVPRAAARSRLESRLMRQSSGGVLQCWCRQYSGRPIARTTPVSPTTHRRSGRPESVRARMLAAPPALDSLDSRSGPDPGAAVKPPLVLSIAPHRRRTGGWHSPGSRWPPCRRIAPELAREPRQHCA
jgi:hypothetical protein